MKLVRIVGGLGLVLAVVGGGLGSTAVIVAGGVCVGYALGVLHMLDVARRIGGSP